MADAHVGRKQTSVLTIEQLTSLCNSFNGQRVHDRQLGMEAGLSRVQTDFLRSIIGKVQFKAVVIDDEMKENIVDDYLDGMAINDIAKKYGFRNPSYIFGIIKQKKVDTNRNGEWSPIKVKQLFHLRDNKKMTFREIGKIVGKSKDCCLWKYHNELKKKEKENELH